MDSQDLNVGVELFSSKYEWGMASGPRMGVGNCETMYLPNKDRRWVRKSGTRKHLAFELHLTPEPNLDEGVGWNGS